MRFYDQNMSALGRLGKWMKPQEIDFTSRELSRNFITAVTCLLSSSLTFYSLLIIKNLMSNLKEFPCRTGGSNLRSPDPKSNVLTTTLSDLVVRLRSNWHLCIYWYSLPTILCIVTQWDQNIFGAFCNLCVSVFTTSFFLVLYLCSAAECGKNLGLQT